MVHLRFIPFYVALACLAAAPQNACASMGVETPETEEGATLPGAENSASLPAPLPLPSITMPIASSAPLSAETPVASPAITPVPAAPQAVPAVPALPPEAQPAAPVTSPAPEVQPATTFSPTIAPVAGRMESARPATMQPAAYRPAMMPGGMPAYGAPAMPYPVSYNMPPMPYGMPPMPYGGFYQAPMMPAYPGMMPSAYSFPPMMSAATPWGPGAHDHSAPVQALASPGGTTINFYGGAMGPHTNGQFTDAGVALQSPAPQPVYWAPPLPETRPAQSAPGSAESAANNIAISVAAPAGAFDTLMVKTGWFSDIVSNNYEDAVAGSFGGKPRQIGADDRDRLRKKQGELFETLYGKTDINGAVSQVALNTPPADKSEQGGSLMGRFMEMFARGKNQDASSGQGCNCQLTLAGAPVNAAPLPQPAATWTPTRAAPANMPATMAPSIPQMQPAAMQQFEAPAQQDPRFNGFALLGYAKASDGKNYPVVQEKESGQLYYGTPTGAPLRDQKTGQYTPFGGTPDQIIKV